MRATSTCLSLISSSDLKFHNFVVRRGVAALVKPLTWLYSKFKPWFCMARYLLFYLQDIFRRAAPFGWDTDRGAGICHSSDEDAAENNHCGQTVEYCSDAHMMRAGAGAGAEPSNLMFLICHSIGDLWALVSHHLMCFWLLFYFYLFRQTFSLVLHIPVLLVLLHQRQDLNS